MFPSPVRSVQLPITRTMGVGDTILPGYAVQVNAAEPDRLSKRVMRNWTVAHDAAKLASATGIQEGVAKVDLALLLVRAFGYETSPELLIDHQW